METEAVRDCPDRIDRGATFRVPMGAAQRRALRPREDERVRFGPDVALEVRFDLGDEKRGQVHGASARFGFRFAENEAAFRE